MLLSSDITSAALIVDHDAHVFTKNNIVDSDTGTPNDFREYRH